MQKRSRVISILIALALLLGAQSLLAPASQAASATISGTVTGIFSTPVANALVYLYYANGAEYDDAATDANGNYSFADVNDGQYLVAVYAVDTDYADGLFDAVLTVNAGVTSVTADVSLVLGTKISGTVIASNLTTPMGGCSVTAWPDDDLFSERTAHTAPDGTFTLRGLSPGEGYYLELDDELACGNASRWLTDGPQRRFDSSERNAGLVDAPPTGVTSLGAIPTIDSLGSITSSLLRLTPSNSHVGDTLSVSERATWSPADVQLAYQWFVGGTVTHSPVGASLVGGTPIPGATGPSFTLLPEHLGKIITLQVKATRLGYSDNTQVLSAFVQVGQLRAQQAGYIAGIPLAGHRLRAIDPVYPAAATVVARQWYRDRKPIPGATGPSYKVTTADKKHKIKVSVTYAANGYAAKNELFVAPYGQFASRPSVMVIGMPQVGKRLSLHFYGTPLLSGSKVHYQWVRNGKPIKGATKSTYTPKKTDHKKFVWALVTYTHKGLKPATVDALTSGLAVKQ